MPGLSQNQVYKQNAKTKEIREEIDWIQLKTNDLEMSMRELKNITSLSYVTEVIIATIRKLNADQQGISPDLFYREHPYFKSGS